MEIDDLSNGDVFAEDSIILKGPIKHTVITSIPSEIFMLDMHDFLKLEKVKSFIYNTISLIEYYWQFPLILKVISRG